MLKTSKPNPEKKQIIQDKKDLNKQVSKSVSLIFDAKSVWNGRPAPNIGVNEKGSINAPIPDESITAMELAIQNLSESLSKLINISERQKAQSNFSSFASNPVSRMFSHIKAPFQFGDKDKWGRLKLLRTFSIIYKKIEQIDEEILSSSDISIPNAIYKSKDLFYLIENEVFNSFKLLFLSKDKAIKKNDKEILDESYDEEENLVETEKPYELIELEYWLKAARIELEALRKRFPQETFKPFLQEWKDLVRKIQYVQQIIKTNFSLALQEHQSLIKEFTEFRNKIDNIKNANVITREFKRKNWEYLTFSSNKQKALRLKADRELNKSLKSVNDIMSFLERANVSPESLVIYIANFVENLIEFYETMADLSEIYNSHVKMMKHKSKYEGEKFNIDIVINTDIRALRLMAGSLLSMSNKLKSLGSI